MSGVNKVILVGNLGADPDLRRTSTGKAVAEMRLATTSTYGGEDKTEWHRIIVWDKAAENVAKYMSKGSKMYIEGRLQTRSYDDKDGNKRYVTEIVANDVQFLDGKGGKASQPEEDPF